MIRRWFRQVGALAVLGWGWQHRGSLVRGADLARRLPALVRDRRTSELAAEAKAIAALDEAVPADMSIRISGIDDGSVLLRGQPAGRSLRDARAALIGVSEVIDVRTDDAGQPTFDSLLAEAQ